MVVSSRAPSRINDLGGWTDTWFAGRGKVLSVSVLPGVHCRLEWVAVSRPVRKRFTLVVGRGERYSFDPGDPPLEKEPLLEAATSVMEVPPGVSVEARIGSKMPAGCAAGTSAAAVTALLGALDFLTPGRMGRDSIWRLAHQVETVKLGWESGVQDQICAAYGGICFIDVHRYPLARVSRPVLGRETMSELQKRLVLVYTGRAHSSSDVHREVIERMRSEGGRSAALELLRSIPPRARESLESGNLCEYGRLMVENTEAQRALHPGLVSEQADRIIEVAGDAGALGWKVNGAGGEGGSVTVLLGSVTDAGPGFAGEVERRVAGVRVVPVRLDDEGLVAGPGEALSQE